MLPTLEEVEKIIKESPELRVHGIDADIDLPDNDDDGDTILANFFDFAPDEIFVSYTFDRDAIIDIIYKTRTIRGATRVIYCLTKGGAKGEE
jgi:hypothetical protein